MEFNEYNESVKNWTNGILDNYRKDAELTIRYCHELIDYGEKTADSKLLGFGYYHLAMILYCLNDYDNIFDIVVRAIDHLEKAQSWSMLARACNILGIITSGRGNQPVAYDYYLDGLMYCKKYGLLEEQSIINVNCGALNIKVGRYKEAMEYFQKAMEYIASAPDEPSYHTRMISLYENMINCKVLESDFTGIDEILEIVEREHLPYADAIDRLGMLISRTFYMHKSGQIEKRDECIRRIDGVITQDMLFMDLIEDFFVYLEVLFESEKIDEFWHLMELMEPMINNLKVTSMQMRLLGLKIRFYRKHHMGAEYLQAAGLYYELSERKELEARAMIKEVIELRANFEKVNRAKKKIEKENKLLAAQSETDPLTGMANRRKLNIQADEMFSHAHKCGHNFAIEILDVDYFKEYNDNYGHQEGDRCLIAIAGCISEVAGAHGGFCARYGGDEFVVIYENISKEDAKEYVEELRRKVMELTLPHRFSKMLPIVTITQGMYCDVPKEENRVWDFLHVADEILYSVKTDNRGSCRVVDRAEFKLMSGYGTTIQGAGLISYCHVISTALIIEMDKADMDENYTYIVRCADGTLYTGWTNDLKKRIKAHNSGKGAKYTKTRRPVELVYFEHFATKEEAMSREYHIKQLKRAQKQALIDEMNKNNKSIFTQNG